MMSPIGLYLAEFASARRRPIPSVAGRLLSRRISSRGVRPRPRRGSGSNRIRAEAFAEGRRPPRRTARPQVAGLEGRHAEHLAEERQRWAEQQGAVADAACWKRVWRTSRAGSRPRWPKSSSRSWDRSLRLKAAAELRDAIERLLANSEPPAIEVTGPADLVEPLRAAFEGRAGVSIVAADVPEVTVLAGDTTIATQLQAWRSGLDARCRGDR